ncbi:hypothetical protein LguiA_005859 [Lonicera macranthoides]
MKVPFTSPQNHNHLSLNPKQANGNTTLQSSSTHAAVSLCYEPKSVLDVRGSPSPTAAKTDFSGVSDNIIASQYSDDPLQLEDHFEDWDSLMRELGLHDDLNSALRSNTNNSQFNHCEPQFQSEIQPSNLFDPTTQFLPSDFALNDVSSNHELNSFELSNDPNWNIGFEFVDELIRFAECFETNSVQLAHAVLARLNLRLRLPTGKPLQRAAFYFKEALQSLLTGSTRLTRSLSSSDVVQTIKAYRTFSNVSPIPMFSNFTANQAILEAVDGSMFVHVIDFDIGLGGHFASFMKEFADKALTRKTNPPVLRITAIVPEEYAIESRLIRDNLCQFARDLEIGFDIEFVSIRTFEYLYFKAIKFVEGEKTAVLLSPAIFRRIGVNFINDLRRMSPQVVVHVDSEGLIGGGTSPFRQTVIDGLEFYSTILESLEAANVGGGGGDWIRKIETFVLLPKMFAAVEAAGRRVPPWREAFAAVGMRPVGLSQFAYFQAECLLRRVQVGGFHVAKRQAEMVLCWHDRALVATSAWRC